MSKYNFEVRREQKRPRFNRGKVVRLLILFIAVAVITAAVIYAVIPKSDPEAPVAVEKTAADQKDVPAVPEEADGDDIGSDDSADIDAGDVPSQNSGMDDGNSDEAENIRAGEENSEIVAKYDPSAEELVKKTAVFRQALNDGSWKKSAEAGSYEVGYGDVMSAMAAKLHTTEKFLLKYNRIKDSNHIELGQRINFVRSGGWQITVSRKDGTLQLDRKVNGMMVPFAIFPCQVKTGKTIDDLVVCFSLEAPRFIVPGKEKIIYDYQEEGNPYGSRRLALARAAKPDSALAYSIHGQGGNSAVAKSLADGSVVLNNDDIDLLFLLVPKYTPVRIIE